MQERVKNTWKPAVLSHDLLSASCSKRWFVILTTANSRFTCCYMKSIQRSRKDDMSLADETHEAFWEQRYMSTATPSGRRPSGVLVRFAQDRTPGTALDLGCARGDDAVWLARNGWSVTGVDVSGTALKAAETAAHAAGVSEKTVFERHDLDKSFPHGSFDLVIAMFLHSPVALDRNNILRRAADSVSPGGLLLIAAHGSRAPWSWSKPGTVFPTAREELDALKLGPCDWNELSVGAISRIAKGPEGQHAEVVDAVIAIERRNNIHFG